MTRTNIFMRFAAYVLDGFGRRLPRITANSLSRVRSRAGGGLGWGPAASTEGHASILRRLALLAVEMGELRVGIASSGRGAGRERLGHDRPGRPPSTLPRARRALRSGDRGGGRRPAALGHVPAPAPRRSQPAPRPPRSP